MLFMYRHPPYRSEREKLDQAKEYKVINTKGLPEQVLENFGLEPASVEESEGSWVLDVPGGKCWVRTFSGDPANLNEVLQWQNYLINQGCRSLLAPLMDKSGKFVAAAGGKNCYATVWPSGEEFSGTNPAHLMAAVREIGKIHHHSSLYQIRPLSSSLADWPMIIQNRLTELLEFYRQLKKQGSKNDFEGIYLENFDFLYDQGQEAIENMVMAGCVTDCPERVIILINNFLPENMVRAGEGIVFKELGFGPAGTGMMDLAQLFNSYLPLHYWDINLVMELLQAYQENEPLDFRRKRLLLSQLRFPGRFWLYAYQYTQGEKKLGELTGKLKSYIHECFWRDKCLDKMESLIGGSEQDECQ